MMATADRRSTPAGEEQGAEDWKVGISTLIGQLRDLVRVMDRSAHQVDTRVYRLGFLTHTGRASLNRQTLEERRVRAENAQLGHPAPSADIDPPGNFRAIAADADLTTTVRQNLRRALRHLKAAGRPVMVQHREATLHQLLDHLDRLVQDIDDDKLLAGIWRDLNTAREATETSVDGTGRALLPDPCPHCGNASLVVDFKNDLIRCDRDPKTGIPSRCICSDPLCECKQKPIAFRHTWYRNPLDPRRTSTADTWSRLAGRLKFRRNANPNTEEPPS